MQLRPRKCSAAAEAIANMEEILTEILLLVPARSVVRFKCVSKHWYSLISHPKFCHRHTLQNPNPNVSAFFFSDRIEKDDFSCIRLGSHGNLSGNPFKSLSENPDGSGLKILQSCNGLFLCVPRSAYVAEGNYPMTIYVVNPTTNQFLALSSPSVRVNNFVRYALAFDPSKSSHYKVVSLSYHHIDIYSSETRTWRVLEISFSSRNSLNKFWDGGITITMENGVYCNGAIHWIRENSFTSYKGEDCWEREDNDLLHYYDIGEECMGVAVPSPPQKSNSICASTFPQRIHRYFGESSGHLYLIDIYWDRKTQFDVMGMPRDYSGWFVRYHVDLSLVNRAPGLHNSYFHVLFLGKEEDQQEQGQEERVSSVLFIPRYHTVMSYNHGNRSKKKTFEISFELTDMKGFLVLHDGYYYMETLASVM